MTRVYKLLAGILLLGMASSGPAEENDDYYLRIETASGNAGVVRCPAGQCARHVIAPGKHDFSVVQRDGMSRAEGVYDLQLKLSPISSGEKGQVVRGPESEDMLEGTSRAPTDEQKVMDLRQRAGESSVQVAIPEIGESVEGASAGQWALEVRISPVEAE